MRPVVSLEQTLALWLRPEFCADLLAHMPEGHPGGRPGGRFYQLTGGESRVEPADPSSERQDLPPREAELRCIFK